ncbi:MAG: hypothetical protein KBT09_06510 [Bacteroidales bacterium]|nr:hypothetical protein [Candidatus Sodaliphilus fimicaballi]
MKKYFSFLAMVATAFFMNAQVAMLATADDAEPDGVTTQVVEMSTTYNTPYDLATLHVNAVQQPSKAPAKKVTPAFPADWTTYIASYKSAATASFADGGGAVQMKQSNGEVGIGNLFLTGSLAVAKPTATEGVYEIPAFQVVGTTVEYGDAVAVPFKVVQQTDAAGKVTNVLAIDSVASGVKVKITSPTSLEFEGLFGYVVKEGESAGAAFYVANGGKIVQPNGMMTWKKLNDDTVYKTVVNATQNGDQFTIINLGGGGIEFTTTLTSRKEVKIGGYPVFYQKLANQFRAFNVSGIEYSNPALEKVYLYNTSLMANAEGDKAITWGPWSAVYSSYTSGYLTEGRIDFDNPITWPEPKTAQGLKGEGTEASPYLIDNNDDWKAVAAASNSGVEFKGQYVKLMADLDFTNDSLPAIGTATTAFYGTFDGGGHTVTAKLTTSSNNQGLIGTLAGGVVKNLNAAGEFNFSGTNSASIVGAARNNSTIENCSSTAHVTLGENSTAGGGVIGFCNFKSVIRNCHFKGVLDVNTNKGSSWVAGVCGYGYCTNFYDCSNEGQINITHTDVVEGVGGINGYTMFSDYENCFNTADITASKWVAGISGYSHTVGSSNAKNCYNTGNITSTVASGNYATAGLFAYMMYGGTYENCYNTGNVTAQGAAAYVGGLFAHYRGSSDYSYITLKNCYNTGNVTANGGNYVGGVAGFAYAASMDACYNTGKVVSNGTAYNKGNSVGGVIGQYQSFTADSTFFKTQITNCYNVGEIESKSAWAGGLIGNFATHNTVANCWNAGKVTALNRSAGLVGYSAYEARIQSSFNVGDVTLTATTKGIGTAANSGAAGILGYGASDLSDCYNTGTITGNGRIAGILAWPYHNTTATYKDHIYYTPSVRNSYNIGKIVADADSCGNIVGVHTFNNGTMWRPDGSNYQYKDTLENVMYLEGMCLGAITGEATNPEVGYDTRQLCQQLPSDKYVSVSDYCFPVLATFKDNAYAKVYAVAVVPSEDEEDPEVITQNFNVGHPAGVEITSSYAGLTIEGTTAKFNGDAYEGEIVLTVAPATTVKNAEGDGQPQPVRQIVLNVKVEQSTGVKDIDSKEVKSVRYYNLNGAQMLEPTGACIQVLEYSDGSQKAVKVIK